MAGLKFLIIFLGFAAGSVFKATTMYKEDIPFTTLWSSSFPLTIYYPAKSITECARRCQEQNSSCEAIAFEKDNITCTLGKCVITQPVIRNSSVDLYQTPQALCNSTPGFNVETYGNTSACLWWSSIRQNFTNARDDCKAKGSNLATFKTLEKLQILQRKQLNVYIGLDDMDVEGVFRWHDDGSVLDSSYSNQVFKKNQPDNAFSGEDCTATDSGLLFDAECWYPFPYVCEKVCFRLQ